MTDDPPTERIIYAEEVTAGYHSGWNHEEASGKCVIGSAFFHGWKLGRNDHHNYDRIAALKALRETRL